MTMVPIMIMINYQNTSVISLQFFKIIGSLHVGILFLISSQRFMSLLAGMAIKKHGQQ